MNRAATYHVRIRGLNFPATPILHIGIKDEQTDKHHPFDSSQKRKSGRGSAFSNLLFRRLGVRGSRGSRDPVSFSTWFLTLTPPKLRCGCTRISGHSCSSLEQRTCTARWFATPLWFTDHRGAPRRSGWCPFHGLCEVRAGAVLLEFCSEGGLGRAATLVGLGVDVGYLGRGAALRPTTPRDVCVSSDGLSRGCGCTRDMKQTICRVVENRRKELCLHVSQLWCLVPGNCKFEKHHVLCHADFSPAQAVLLYPDEGSSSPIQQARVNRLGNPRDMEITEGQL